MLNLNFAKLSKLVYIVYIHVYITIYCIYCIYHDNRVATMPMKLHGVSYTTRLFDKYPNELLGIIANFRYALTLVIIQGKGNKGTNLILH